MLTSFPISMAQRLLQNMVRCRRIIWNIWTRRVCGPDCTAEGCPFNFYLQVKEGGYFMIATAQMYSYDFIKRFGNMVAVDNVSLDIVAGEFFVMLGQKVAGQIGHTHTQRRLVQRGHHPCRQRLARPRHHGACVVHRRRKRQRHLRIRIVGER